MQPPMPWPKRLSPQTRTLIIIGLAFSASVAITVFAVPLYNLMCKQLGIARPTVPIGQTGLGQVSGRALTPAEAARRITVRFTANTAQGVPIEFYPLSYTIQAKLGEPVLTAYAAKNLQSKGLDGVAVHMLYAMGGPDGINVADYVALEQCFCFAQQYYPGKEAINLPLSFTLSPDLPAGIHTITFSYTLFEALPDDPRVKKNKG
jgi:cytochrome c oxidase assembly protein subunit 11